MNLIMQGRIHGHVALGVHCDLDARMPPRIRLTTGIGTPACSSVVAATCRRSWKRHGGSPEDRASRVKARDTEPGRKGDPSGWVKTSGVSR